MEAAGDPLTTALAEAVAIRRATDDDTAVLAALQTVVDQMRVQLSGLQDEALAAADVAMQRLQTARRSGDRAAAVAAFEVCRRAMAHAELVSDRVAAALQDLAAVVVEVSGPALDRLERTVAATQALVEIVERGPELG